jgi:hypothetical protein
MVKLMIKNLQKWWRKANQAWKVCMLVPYNLESDPIANSSGDNHYQSLKIYFRVALVNGKQKPQESSGDCTSNTYQNVHWTWRVFLNLLNLPPETLNVME